MPRTLIYDDSFFFSSSFSSSTLADSKSSDFMRRCQTEIQRQTNCFDLASIVIKPVQRILKYPLLINELSKCTEEGHTDWEPLQRAMEMLTDIAQSINENKRRQDLIQKYCKSSDTSFSSRLKSLNAHTVKKKGSRIANRIISTLTFSSVHNVGKMNFINGCTTLTIIIITTFAG